MRYRERRYRWEWDLEAGREALWPLVADTNRFNRDTGVPSVGLVAEEGAGRRRLRLSRLGIGVEWREEPFEWVRPHRFSVVRRYLRGPLVELIVAVELVPRDDGGTRLVYEVSALPRNLLGRLGVPLQIGILSRRRFERTFREYDRIARTGERSEERPRLAPRGRERLEGYRRALVAQAAPAPLVERLADTIERGDELTVARLRPYALADAWGAGRREVLELCLRATRVGLLDLRWDLLCPLCRGVKETAATLADVRSRAHCETCVIDFTVNFEQSVELTFRPSASVREVEGREFCLAGPGVTPHVAGQQLLAPGEERELVLDLETGRYRLRTLQLPGARAAVVEDGGAEAVAVRLGDPAWPGGELRLARTPTLRVANDSEREQLLVVERTAWSDQAATAAEVTALQLFRDLFANEALRPDEPISVGSLTVVFTDLRDSTRFYRQVGDAPAFGSVMSHLDVLREAVASEGGAVVKTMGDAVMAVFRRPASAVRALLAAQRTLAAAGTPPLSLKAGVHHGACIAVRQNDRLDYFGSTVNAAARLVDLSAGDEMVVSDAVRSDPEIADLLAERPELELEPLQATLKGFDDERFALWRLRARVDSVEDARAAAR